MQLINTFLAGVAVLMTVSAQYPILQCPNLDHYNVGILYFQQPGPSGTNCFWSQDASCNLSPAASVCYIKGKVYPVTNNPDGTVTVNPSA
ncbi:hypothetical protein MP228_002391 [Amoeboaphelidium protococcarum]|nr:hypothetical protein MP228_002391 [Amoeboaphelidium protococcarum]